MTSEELVERETLLDARGLERMLQRLAHQLVERQPMLTGLALVGIHTGGVPLAERLKAIIDETEGVDIALGMIDITLYRDDVMDGLPQPVIGETRLPFEVTGRRIVLVDDVLYTGRTVRAALDAIIDFGRPQVIELVVVADRGHREFPIQADYVGTTVATERSESVKLELRETGSAADRLVRYARAS